MKKVLTLCAVLITGLMTFTSCSGGNGDDAPVSNDYIRLATGGTSIALSQSETSKSVDVQSNCSWQVSIADNSNWQTLSITSSPSGSGNQNVILATDANSTTSRRTATLLFTKSTGNISFTVTQEAGEQTFSVSPKEYEFPADGGQHVFFVEGNVAWKATAPEWCTLNKTEGKGGLEQLTVTVGENPNTTALNGQIVFTGEKTATINISQLGKAYSLTVSTNAFNMDAVGGDYEITMACNGSWRINIDNSAWCSVDKTSGTANTSGERVKVTCKPNTTTVERKANITIVAGNDAKIETIVATQLAATMPEVSTPQYQEQSSTEYVFTASYASMFDVREYGFCYGREANPTSKVVVGRNGGKSGTMQTTLTLEEGVVYYVRSYAVSDVGTTYSNDITVETKGNQPGKGDNPTPDL